MKLRKNLFYRFQQFWLAINPPSFPVPTEAISIHLNAMQLTLFRKLQASEQWHAYRVFKELKDNGCIDSDLLRAGLLHDIGKIMFPLHTWNRATIVLANKIMPKLANRWGHKSPQGFYKQFTVAARHALWGADLVAKTGGSDDLIYMIRNHEKKLNGKLNSKKMELLKELQIADNNN